MASTLDKNLPFSILPVTALHSQVWAVPSLSALVAVITLLLVYLRTHSQKASSPTAVQVHGNHGSKSSPSSTFLPYDVIIIFGSQTGTAEDYAKHTDRVLFEHLELVTTVVDMKDFGLEQLVRLPHQQSPSKKPVLLLVITSTYGDGEPPDNAVELHDALRSACEGEKSIQLDGLHYAVFGLGNSSYELFNKQAIDYDDYLAKMGGSRICKVGLADDSTGSTDEDFQGWKADLLSAVSSKLDIKAMEVSPETSRYKILEDTRNEFDKDVYLGERNEAQLHNSGDAVGSCSASNPLYVPLSRTAQLCNSNCERQCLHAEFDISGTNLEYETGDHLAILPINPDSEVERILHMLDLWEKRKTVFEVQSNHGSEKFSDIPTPTTYECAVRHYLDICGPISRSSLERLSAFAPSEAAQKRMLDSARSKDEFKAMIQNPKLNLAQLLQSLSAAEPWSRIPFTYLLEEIPVLRPRYYSISSSSTVSPRTIHITMATSSEHCGGPTPFKGLTSQYMMAAASLGNRSSTTTSTHHLMLPRSQHRDAHIAIHTRRSHFRLPPDVSTPIIMIGPGTGVAPFRAFMAERKHQSEIDNIGKCLLFTGCRKRDEDFLYRAEWQAYAREMGDKFELHTAFSRELAEKVYVQHRLAEQKQSVIDLLDRHAASIYICGDVKMAKDVIATLMDIIIEYRSCSVDTAREVIDDLKSSGRLQEDVW